MNLFLVFSSIMVIILSVLLVPAVRVRWDVNFAHGLQARMIAAVCQEPLNTQLFWELRQRSTQGYFTGNTMAVKENAVLELYQLIGSTTLIAQYHSDTLTSTESLTLPVTLHEYLSRHKIIPGRLICQTATSIVFEKSDTIEIYFIADRDKMRQTLGILDFQGPEQKLIDTTLWLHHSVITHR